MSLWLALNGGRGVTLGKRDSVTLRDQGSEGFVTGGDALSDYICSAGWGFTNQ